LRCAKLIVYLYFCKSIVRFLRFTRLRLI
jgi:hypothetical protein